MAWRLTKVSRNYARNSLLDFHTGLALAKERRTLRLIREHEKRVELLKVKHHRRKVAQAWLDILAQNAVYRKVVSVFEDADKARKENEQRKMELKRLSEKASIIQKAVRSKLLKDLNGQHLCGNQECRVHPKTLH